MTYTTKLCDLCGSELSVYKGNMTIYFSDDIKNRTCDEFEVCEACDKEWVDAFNVKKKAVREKFLKTIEEADKV